MLDERLTERANPGYPSMSVDRATVRRIARLARLAITEEEAGRLEQELSGIQQYDDVMKEQA